MLIKNKLISIIAAMIILAITISWIDLNSLWMAGQVIKNYGTIQIPTLLSLMDMKSSLGELKFNLMEASIWENNYQAQEHFNKILEKTKKERQDMEIARSHYEILAHQPEEVVIWEKVKVHWSTFMQYIDQMFDILKQLARIHNAEQQKSLFKSYFDLINKIKDDGIILADELDNTSYVYRKISETSYTHNNDIQASGNFLVLLASGLGIFVIIFLGASVIRSVMRQIGDETNATRNALLKRIALIQRFPLFIGEEKHSRARLSAHVDNCHELIFQAGETLFKAGDQAVAAYFLQEGRVILPETQKIISENTLFAKEVIIDDGCYLHSAVAETQVKVLLLDKMNLKDIAENNSQVKNNLSNLLLEQKAPSTKIGKIKTLPVVIGWLCSMVIPMLIFLFGKEDFNESQTYFLMIFSSTLCIWIFNLLPEYMGAIFIVVGSLILGLAPVDVILAGYSSSSFFMALSVFALGAVIVQSGLIYRISMLLLYYLPSRTIFYEIALVVLGIVLTPLLPSANGRVSLLTPLLIDIIETMGYKKGGCAATRLSTAVFSGLSLFSASFLTSKSVNFAVFELLPTQVAEQFTLSFWFTASIVSFLILLICNFIFSLIFYQGEEAPQNKDVDIKKNIGLQLNILGRLTFSEWVAITFITIFIIGLMTAPIHKIQPSWIGMGILFGLLSLGSFTTKDFRLQVDWPFLFMLAGLIGMVQVMSVLGIEKWITKYLVWVGVLMGDNFFLFVMVLSGVTFALRFILPNNASIILLSSIYIPISLRNGINPWIIAFIILLLSDTWFMSYQCTYYQAFNDLTEKKHIYNKKKFMLFNLLTTIFRIIAIYASIPFWRAIGLL
ncbi:membrane hypothetical protein [Gammaproteobacteria bacterium]